MTDFTSLGLAPELLQAISALKFETPTPVQEKIIPHLLESEEDLVALAQTGTGKTAAFGLPLLHMLNLKEVVPQALILAPTRELCLQICRDIKLFSKYIKNIRTVAIYGGTPIVNQLRALENGVHIIVATPGRIHDVLRRKKADFSNIRWTVLDEADEMLNMGFEEDLTAILSHVPEHSQKLLFSATMPKQVQAIAGNYMRSPVEITVGTRNAGAENVSHQCYMVHAKDRYLALKRLVDVNPSIYGLVFCRTRSETQDIAARLIKDGYNADALHGDLSQVQRDRVMAKFREKSIQILVATDVAARGLDVTNLTHVINYQLPDDLESYTHRSGRTGRAGKSGISIVLINMREKFKIKHIEKKIGKKFEFKTVPSGVEVCEAQLLNLLERVKNVEIDEQQIAPYLPKLDEMLNTHAPAELMKRFVALEFNRFLDYYRNAPDLNVAQSGKGRALLKDKAVTIFINVGRKDRFSPKDLMGIINRGSRGKSIAVGKINITPNCAFVDVPEAERDTVLAILSKARHAGKKIFPEIADGNKTRRKPRDEKASSGPRDARPTNRKSRKRGNERKATAKIAEPQKRGRNSQSKADDNPVPAWARKVAGKNKRGKKR